MDELAQRREVWGCDRLEKGKLEHDRRFLPRERPVALHLLCEDRHRSEEHHVASDDRQCHAESE